jgi:Rps23 Pro-64 3,4-dihydroxylase Tpa1-like proline 4-hydroxylase
MTISLRWMCCNQMFFDQKAYNQLTQSIEFKKLFNWFKIENLSIPWRGEALTNLDLSSSISTNFSETKKLN